MVVACVRTVADSSHCGSFETRAQDLGLFRFSIEDPLSQFASPLGSKSTISFAVPRRMPAFQPTIAAAVATTTAESTPAAAAAAAAKTPTDVVSSTTTCSSMAPRKRRSYVSVVFLRLFLCNW
jgi:hypothetical protein